MAQRVNAVTDTPAVWLQNAKHFLAACLASQKMGIPFMFLASNAFYAQPNKDVRTWCQRRFAQLCPELQQHQAPLPPQPQATPTPQPGFSPADIAQMFQTFMTAQQAATGGTATIVKEKKDDGSGAPLMGMAALELQHLLIMCGLKEGQDDFLPKIWKQLSEPSLSKEGKNIVIRRCITSRMRYDYSPVPLLAPLLHTIRTREWSGNSAFHTVYSATKGLTSFLLTGVTEEDKAKFN